MKEYFGKIIPQVEKSVKDFFEYSTANEFAEIFIKKEAWESILRAPFDELFSRGGKRIRPILSNLTYEALGGAEDISKYIIIPEIIHTGTVMIDDIQDHSELRRGGKTIHTLYGEELTINNGNFLYFYPQLILKQGDVSVDKKLKIFEEIALQMTKIHLGQGMDIYRSEAKNFDITMEEYLQMCAYKTGTLLNLSIRMGAILANANSDVIEKLGKIGESIGIAFQIKDDILNLKPLDGWGKETGEDISEGKITYMIIDALQNATDEDKQVLKSILASSTKDIVEIQKAISIIDKYDGFAHAGQYAENIINDAKITLQEIVPDSKFRTIYLQILDYIVARGK